MPLRLVATVSACIAITAGVALADAPPPVLPAPVVPRPTCVDDQSAPRQDVEAAFAELQKIHRGRVAGPAGQRLIDSRVNDLLDRLVGFDVFVDIALGDAWDAAQAEQKDAWRATLRETLRRRYLNKLGSPLKAKVDITSVIMRCDKAEVALRIVDRKDESIQDVILQLVASPPADAGVVWRAYDVSVDGVSLLETWRSRFRHIYADGGVSAVEHHMRGLAERYNLPR